jgi:hypothetical protein
MTAFYDEDALLLQESWFIQGLMNVLRRAMLDLYYVQPQAVLSLGTGTGHHLSSMLQTACLRIHILRQRTAAAAAAATIPRFGLSATHARVF